MLGVCVGCTEAMEFMEPFESVQIGKSMLDHSHEEIAMIGYAGKGSSCSWDWEC